MSKKKGTKQPPKSQTKLRRKAAAKPAKKRKKAVKKATARRKASKKTIQRAVVNADVAYMERLVRKHDAELREEMMTEASGLSGLPRRGVKTKFYRHVWKSGNGEASGEVHCSLVRQFLTEKLLVELRKKATTFSKLTGKRWKWWMCTLHAIEPKTSDFGYAVTKDDAFRTGNMFVASMLTGGMSRRKAEAIANTFDKASAFVTNDTLDRVLVWSVSLEGWQHKSYLKRRRKRK